jgi:general stress protein YciG
MIRGTGFGSMDKERLKEVAAQGGKSAHAQGKAYRFSSEAAREAALKGAEAKRKKKENEGN